MNDQKKALISLITWFLLFTALNVLFGFGVCTLPTEDLARITFSSRIFIVYLLLVTLHLPIISYSFYFARKCEDRGQRYRLTKHFFITNLGFSIMGFVGIITELF